MKTFSPLRAASALAEPSLEEPFYESAQRASRPLTDAAALVSFFRRCPADLKPSLNKAFFFIEKGGFSEHVTIGDGPHQKPYKEWTSKLKQSWRLLAPSGCFALAAIHHDFEELLDLPLDGEYAVKTAGKVLQRVDKLQLYFGLAKYIQNDLIKKLDKSIRERSAFAAFSRSVVETPIQPTPFTENQLKLIKSYVAPKFSLPS
jgi:hypothetical protein